MFHRGNQISAHSPRSVSAQHLKFPGAATVTSTFFTSFYHSCSASVQQEVHHAHEPAAK
jgi:hypothetical protein